MTAQSGVAEEVCECIGNDDIRGAIDHLNTITTSAQLLPAQSAHTILSTLLMWQQQQQQSPPARTNQYQTLIYATCHKSQHLEHVGTTHCVAAHSDDESGCVVEGSALCAAACCGDATMCRVLLQCGTDMTVTYTTTDLQTHVKLIDAVLCDNDSATGDQFSSDIKRAFMMYKPGLWSAAVERQDIGEVRRLVNLWCRTDIQHPNGETLLEDVYSTGNEEIIRLFRGITPSMKLVYGVLSDDCGYVEKVLNFYSKKDIIVDFRNMGGSYGAGAGVTSLYVAIVNGNPALVTLLLRDGGASVTTTVAALPPVTPPVHEAGGSAAANTQRPVAQQQCPILLSILTRSAPPVSLDALHSLVEHCKRTRVRLCDLYYQGKNMLQTAIEHDLPSDIISAILQSHYITLVTHRNKYNKTCRDIAYALERHHIVHLIDNYVFTCVTQPDDDGGGGVFGRRKLLALEGYDHIADARNQEGASVADIEDDSVRAFLQELPQYETCVKSMYQALVGTVDAAGNWLHPRLPDLDDLPSLLTYSPGHGSCNFITNITMAKLKCDGTPLLHKLVLQCSRVNARSIPLVCTVIRHLLYQATISIDSIRDQCERTALHYACGIPEAEELVELLESYGGSMVAMDMDDRVPTDFGYVRDTPEMKTILKAYRTQSHQSVNEERLWSEAVARVRRCGVDAAGATAGSSRAELLYDNLLLAHHSYRNDHHSHQNTHHSHQNAHHSHHNAHHSHAHNHDCASDDEQYIPDDAPDSSTCVLA